MRKALVVLVTVLVICSLTAMAANKSLNDRQMAAITAGGGYSSSSTEASGAVVAGNSSATINDSYGVNLGSYAQEYSQGLNIVDSSGGKVIGAVNVWDGKTTLSPVSLNVSQANYLTQAAPAGANLYNYQSSGTLNVVNPNLSISNTYANLNVGYVSDQYLQVKNTYDNFTGLTGGFNFNQGYKSTSLSAGFCLICNTYDKFNLTYNDFNAAWANLDFDKFNLDFTASSLYWQGPITIGNASAGYIVVDGSTLNETSNSQVALGSYAESYASGVNIVNAANSLVGLGANVAASPSSVSTFKQVNMISQK